MPNKAINHRNINHLTPVHALAYTPMASPRMLKAALLEKNHGSIELELAIKKALGLTPRAKKPSELTRY
jgi:hypothetical protein